MIFAKIVSFHSRKTSELPLERDEPQETAPMVLVPIHPVDRKLQAIERFGEPCVDTKSVSYAAEARIFFTKFS